MYTLYKFHFLNGISEINQLFDDILIIWPAPVYISAVKRKIIQNKSFCLHNICICTVFVYDVYINTHVQYIFFNIYMYIFISIYFILYINIFNI